jgi:hypothetical protein
MPIVMLWQAESLYFTEEDAGTDASVSAERRIPVVRRLVGNYAWENFEREMAKVFPEPAVSNCRSAADASDVPHENHAEKIPQIPAINYWMRSGGDTSEQGADSAQGTRPGHRLTRTAA